MSVSNFSVKAKGKDGIPYRVDVNGGGTIIEADGQFLVIERGESDSKGLNPIWPSKLRLFMREVDISPLFGQADRSVSVEVYDITGGTDTLVFKGYMVTDFFGDAPFAASNLVELQALDGLGTLENDSLADYYNANDTYAPVTEVISKILGTLHDIDIEFGVEWYPDAGGALSSSDCPLRYVGVNPNNYRESRPTGGWFDQLSVLKDLCKSNGLTVRQVRRDSGARWHLRQRGAIDGGSIQVWVFDTNGTQQSFGTKDRSVSFALDGTDVKRGIPREFDRREQSLTVSHDHKTITGLISEGSFEGPLNSWTLQSSQWHVSEVISHDNAPPTQDATSDNSKVLHVYQDVFVDATDEDIQVAATQNGPIIGSVPPGSSLRLRFRMYDVFDLALQTSGSEIGTLGNGAVIKIQIDDDGTSYTLEPRYSGLTEDYTKGPNKFSLDSALAQPLYEGARYPVVKNKNSDTFGAFIEVSEFTPAGSTELRGVLSQDVGGDEFFTYPSLTTSNTWFDVRQWSGVGAFRNVDIPIPLQDESGNRVSGSLTYQIGISLIQSSNSPEDFHQYYDEFEVDVVGPAGSPLNETLVQGSVPELGEDESQTVRTASGPSPQNIAALDGRKPGGGEYEPTEWGLGAGVTDGVSLVALKIRERLRYWRNHNEVLRLSSLAFAGGPSPVGDEVVTVDGTDYTIKSLTYDAGTGEVEVQLTELSDRGTGGISITKVLQEGEGSTEDGPSTFSVGGETPSETGSLDVVLAPSGGLKFNQDDELLVEPKDFAGNGLRDDGTDDQLGIAVGGVGTPELANDAVTPLKLDETGVYEMAGLGINDPNPTYDLDAAGQVMGRSGLLSDDTTGTEDYLAKRRDWQVTKDGRADFRSIFADELVVKKFTSDLTQTLAGSDILAKSTSTLSSDFTVPESTAGAIQAEDGTGLLTEAGDPLEGHDLKEATATLTVDDLPGAKGQRVFEPGDWVQLRYYDNSGGGLTVQTVWGTVSGYSDNGDGTQDWTFQLGEVNSLVEGKTINENSQVVSYGQEGQGLIRRSVEGSTGPYSIIETWTEDPIQGENYTGRVVTGNMDAAPNLPSGTDPKGYGLFSDNVYLSGHIEARTGQITDAVAIGGRTAQEINDELDGAASSTNLGTLASLDLINDVTLIQDGLIVTDLLAADAVTAEKIDVQDLFAQEITIQANGSIRGTNGDFILASDGLTLKAGSSFYSEGSIDWVFDDGTNAASISVQDTGSQQNVVTNKGFIAPKISATGLLSGHQLRINDGFDTRTSHPTKSDLSKGEARIYTYNPAGSGSFNGDVEVWVAARGLSNFGDPTNFNKIEILATS